MPDELLFSLVVIDSARADTPSVELEFLEIDLTDYEDRLAALPDSVFIGLGNAGEDGNYIALSVSDYEDENVSYLYLPGPREPHLAALSPLSPTRVTTSSKTAWRRSERRSARLRPGGDRGSGAGGGGGRGAGAVGARRRLPQPLQPPPPPSPTASPRPPPSASRSTTRLGRRVALLLDGAVQQAGPHEVAVEAATWPSGLYLYTLEAAGQRRTGKMALVK